MAKMKWKTQEQIDAEIAEAERLASIPSEVEQLKAQVQASSTYTDFLEEVIIEMAQVVYAGD